MLEVHSKEIYIICYNIIHQNDALVTRDLLKFKRPFHRLSTADYTNYDMTDYDRLYNMKFYLILLGILYELVYGHRHAP